MWRLAIAVFIGLLPLGAANGVEKDPSSKDSVLAEPDEEKYYTVSYNVDDLLTVTDDGKPDYQALIDAIKTRVLPPTWETAGGKATVAAYEMKRCLVVSHKHTGHKELVRFIRQLRANK